jgi:tubulin polyglutamylase TTLL6/13
MKIYIYEEGFARFATKDYKSPKKSNLKDAYIHLTNYAINK